MPSLPPQRLYYRTEDDQEYNAKVTAGVTVDGVFTIGVPDNLLKSAKSLVHKGSNGNPDHIALHTPYRAPARVQCSCLAHGINFLKACAADYMKAEETVERVIIYKLDAYCSAWISKSGFYPNGHVAPDDEGVWWTPKSKMAHGGRDYSYNNGSSFTLGFGAAVMDRKTMTRSSGETVVWESVEDDNADDAIKRLNGFVGVQLDPDHEHFETMPYTPQAAEFFVQIMLAISQLVINVDAFFADTKRFELAIKNSGDSPFLLTAPTTTTPAKPTRRRK